MNCANHVDVPAVAYCRTCGKPLCSTCKRDVRGVIYCEECLASHLSGTMPPPGTTAVPPGVQPPPPGPPTSGGKPALAALLGLIPGVGAFYNGEYAKGFLHVLIFATLIWMTDHVSGMFGIAIAAFYFYMPIEAYKTAKAHEMGMPGPDPFGLNNLFGPAVVPPPPPPPPEPRVAPVVGMNPGPAGSTPEFDPNAPHVAPPVYVPMQPAEPEPQQRVPIGALILIGLGVLFLLNQFRLFYFDWGRFWPLILIAVGVAVLVKRRRVGM